MFVKANSLILKKEGEQMVDTKQTESKSVKVMIEPLIVEK